MDDQQSLEVEGARVTVRRLGRAPEIHEFASEDEARGRAAIITEALTWIGTPFRDCADVKGGNGAVDCAMLLVRCYVDTGRIAPFDPRPYPPRWHLHRDEERFLGFIEKLGGRHIEKPKLADIVVWQFGRCFSHGGIVVNSTDVVHSYYAAGQVLISSMDDPVLRHVSLAARNFPRPVRYYDVWSTRP
jgi:cell wall-associated NlpC family hydrolase